MNEESKTGRAHFYIDKDGLLAESAMILLILSSVFRLIGSFGKWKDEFFVAAQIILPLLSCILFVLCIQLFSKKLFCLSAIPVLMGAAFFVIRALGFESMVKTVLCVVLYTTAAIIYTGTVFGLIKTKWLLPPLFGLPFLYKIFIEDLAAMRDTVNPVTFTDGMMEMSVLCVVAALFFIGLGLKKLKDEQEVRLPKIKAPIVIAPNRTEDASDEQPEAEPWPEAVDTEITDSIGEDK